MTRRRCRWLLLVALAVALAAGSALAAPQLDDLAESEAAPAVLEHVPRLRHVFVIVLENHDRSAVVGSAAAPAFARLAREGAALTDYHAVGHPSLPNYLALVSGSTHGIASDCTTCSVRAPSLATLVPGHDWKTYAEGLPSPGWQGGGAGLYAKKHDPLLYFRDVAGRAALRSRVVPLRRLGVDLRAGSLPRFALVVPNLCHDMHSCPVETGDRWLGRFLPKLLSSPSFAGGVAFVVFDEGSRGSTVPALAVGPAVRAGASFRLRTDHYGLLRTIEQGLGLHPLLGRARTAQAIGSIWR